MKNALSLLAFSLVGSACSLLAQTPEPLHYWAFTEVNGGVAVDAGTAGSGATLRGGAHNNKVGVNTQGLGLPSGDAAAVFTSTSINQLTLAAWMRVASMPDPAAEVYAGRIIEAPAYTLFVSNNPTALVFEYRYDDFYEAKWRWNMPASELLGKWNQAAVVFDPMLPTNIPTLYLNGQPVAGGVRDKLSEGAPIDNAGTGYIGNRQEGDRRFLGMIDEVMVFDALLTQQQINEVSLTYLPEEYFSFFNSEYRDGDWVYADWMGWVFVRDFPWCMSARQGWFYVDVATDFGGGNAYFAATREDNGQPLGWVHLSRDSDNLLYHFGLEAWIQYDPNSVRNRYWNFQSESFIITNP
ncbi:MAG: LamG domain-containing protein [Verrucomicrobiota bacterium JB022]|nr:LamG domain-containing protein [Verrucomicrobiota bacterium JB022]